MNELVVVAGLSSIGPILIGVAAVITSLNLTRKVEMVATRVEAVHAVAVHADEQVTTMNSKSMANLADDDETRRIEEIPAADRSIMEEDHLADAAALGEQQKPPEPQPERTATMRTKLYDFRTMPEIQWTIIVGAIGALAGSAANFFGANVESVGTTSVVAASLARGVGGLLRDDYDFKSWWEVAWAGIQAGSGAIAAAIASTTSADALQTTVIATAASSVGRQVLAALIASVERAFSGGLIDDGAPPTP